ncbi:MAG: fumarylacetoacetate hydrolase family protein [Roseitalea sp.]|jgi:2-keto-4-pentenoate hydratase|nr:fumarylacetoacetate hydrolase family protein [Roseitalea sp.]MBO6720788.1 fumarylacetoacetate hydrolase family protein [Roseitalea sp.]MBO6743935.1 fumarylacetoacetate hydrolase family protein [Roseitalea sp.]
MTDPFDAAARRLRQAYAGTPIPPMREALDPTDIDAAYAVQAINTRFWATEGRRIVGRKIGLTSVAVQKQLGVDRPDFGVLFDDMRIDNGGVLPRDRVIQPKAEAEVALILARDINDADATPEVVAAATRGALAAIEIVDSRIADWKITFADTVADNGSSAFFVLGDEERPLDGLDLETCKMQLTIDEEIVSTGIGSACLGHPLQAAAWLARTMAARGEPLRAGDVVLTGALGPMVAFSPGARVTASIDGLGSVGFTCEGAPT